VKLRPALANVVRPASGGEWQYVIYPADKQATAAR
jgi:hypothetical protein